jgi:hypothetical protein
LKRKEKDEIPKCADLVFDIYFDLIKEESSEAKLSRVGICEESV